jgi:ribonucleotide monophosphatase NagD (HAD superfamily)
VTDDPQPTTIGALLARHDGILLDAYGVLVDASGPLPGAEDLIAELAARRFPYAIVTNDASRSQDTQARRFAGLGMPIPPDRFVTSGSLLPGYYAEAGLAGARTMVLGTADSVGFVVAGGGAPVPLEAGADLDALAVCDDAGFPFLDGIEIAQSAVIRAVEAGRRPALILPNPDLVYPKGGGELGLTAGSIALVIEAVLVRRFGGDAPRFVHLGKPEPRLFVEAARRLAVPADRLVMIGDQLETDIAGAHAAGIDAALLAGGVSSWDRTRAHVAPPRYRLASLAL